MILGVLEYPKWIEASTDSNTGIVITWEDVSAERYTLYRNNRIYQINITGTSYEDIQINSDENYSYRVQAFVDSCGSSLSPEDIGISPS